MTKHASTSNCVSKDGGGGRGGVPSLLPSPSPSAPSPCSPPSLCMPSLPPLSPSSPWSRPRAAAAANDDSSEHGAPPQPPPPSLLPSTWGGGVHASRPAVVAPFGPSPPHPRGGSGLSRRRWRRQSSPPIFTSPFPPQRQAVWRLTYISTTNSTAHTVLQMRRRCRCSRRAWDGREGEENDNDDGGAAEKRRDPTIKCRLPPPTLLLWPEPPSPSS
jgi:hypothetical protein